MFSNQWKIQVADFFSMKLLLLCVWNVWCHRHIMVATDNSECSTDPSACRSITVSEPLRLRQKMSATCKRNQRKIKLQVDVSCIPITQFHPSPYSECPFWTLPWSINALPSSIYWQVCSRRVALLWKLERKEHTPKEEQKSAVNGCPM